LRRSSEREAKRESEAEAGSGTDRKSMDKGGVEGGRERGKGLVDASHGVTIVLAEGKESEQAGQ
jgi:hypothetical protein